MYRERHAVLAELQRCGITVINVAAPNALSRTQSVSIPAPQSHLPVKRTASGSSIPSVVSAVAPLAPPAAKGGLHEQICAGIEAYLQRVTVAPYAMAIPKHFGKRCESPHHNLRMNRRLQPPLRCKHNDGPDAEWSLFHATHAAAAAAIRESKTFKSTGGPLGVGL